MAISLTAWDQYMVADLPMVHSNLRQQALQDAIRFFCNDTFAWQETIEDLDLVADQADYDLAAGVTALGYATCEIVQVIWVKVDGIEQSKTSYELHDFATLHFLTAPSAAATDALDVKVAIAPDKGTNDINEAFFNRWIDGILAKAKASLLGQKGKPYSNEKRAFACEIEYLRHRAAAVAGKWEGHINKPIIAMPREHSWL